MPMMYGPAHPRRVDRRRTQPDQVPGDEPPFVSAALSLGGALADYCAHFDASIAPYDGSWEGIAFQPGERPKYFVYRDRTHTLPRLVDIHVRRDQMWSCPGQDLAFALQADDEVEIGELIC